ncbi:MAG: hypothetical protein IJ176_01740 [Prevotella sp.]|nr:hypothetical protein [Prevotella sp.]
MKEDEKTIDPQAAEPAAQPDATPQEEKEEGQPTALEQMRQQARESDDAPIGSLTLKQIVGGDYLLLLVRNHIWLIVLIVMITTVYVGFRYQCQQDMIEIDRLEKELTDAKYKAMSSSSNLTELCRQSHVLQVLRANQDSLLRISDQPPYKIEVKE